MTRRSGGHQASIGLNAAQGPLVATYQTRISDYGDMDRLEGDAALSAYGELYGQVQRKLFADVAAGRSAVLLKNDYIREYGIPARMFNAVRVSLEGKASAVRAAQKLRVDSLERRIAQAERQVAQAEEQGRWQQVHEKRRRLASLRSRLAGLEAELRRGGCGCASGRNGCGGSSINSRSTTMRAMRSGNGTGVMPAVMSSSCWAAETKRRAVSSASPVLPTTVR